MRTPFILSISVLLVAMASACGKVGALAGGAGNGSGGASSGSCSILANPGSPNSGFSASAGLFTYSPLDVNTEINTIAPLGNLIAPGHVFPSDHIYLYMQGSTAAGAHNVIAPADGNVVGITTLNHPGGFVDYTLYVAVDRSFWWFVGHVQPAPGITVGSTITAGDVVATNSGWSTAVDFGVYNWNQSSNPGVLDDCIQNADGMTDAPLSFYQGALRTALYNRVNSASTPDGTIGLDVAGELVGFWTQEGNANPLDQNFDVTFGYQIVAPGIAQIASGGTGLPQGDYTVGVSDPDFRAVTPSSGVVTYHLSGSASGVLLVQLVSAGRLKLEFFPGAGSASFDSNAVYFVR